MSKTVKRDPYNPYSKESKEERKKSTRKYRNEVDDRMRHNDFDNIPRKRGTEGWNTY